MINRKFLYFILDGSQSVNC